MLEDIQKGHGSPPFALLHLPTARRAAEHRRDLVALSQDLLFQMVPEAVLPCAGWTWSLLAGVWVIFQLYVLSQTTNQELRQQRYVDIFLGLLLLASLLCLLYGSYSESRLWVVGDRLHHRLPGRGPLLLVLLPLQQPRGPPGDRVPGRRGHHHRGRHPPLPPLRPPPYPCPRTLPILGVSR